MRLIITMILVVMPLAVLAEVSAMYELADGRTMELNYKDDNHIRMDMPASNQFMLLNGDDTYMVRKQKGQWLAIDLASMAKMMQQMGNQSGGSAEADSSGDVEFSDTGRTETIAGYEGQVYEVTDSEGNTREMVLSDHDNIIELSRAWVEFSGSMMEKMGAGNEQMQQDMLSKSDLAEYGGPLRVDDDMRLKSVSTDSKGSAYYELPEDAKVQDMSNMGGGMMQSR